MKTAIGLLCLTYFSAAFACNQEAQFIGKVSGVRHLENNECVFQVNTFKSYASSMVCPLDQDEVVGYEFSDKNCSVKNGDTLSGVLVKSADSIVIE